MKDKTKGYTKILKNWDLYLLLVLPFLYIIIFNYLPMYGAQIVFRDYSPVKGFFGSPWVGMKHFVNFFKSYDFKNIFFNTLSLSLYSLVASFPIPIILALSFHYCNRPFIKKVVQLTTYAPNFISVIVICGMILEFFALRTGMVNVMLTFFGRDQINFMGDPKMFPHIYVWSGIWQGAGWGAIIYLAALAGISIDLHEAAILDGAGMMKRIWHIDLPGIAPTIVVMLILSLGGIMNVGFEKVLLLQNALNLSSSEVIQTYVYKMGIASDLPNISYTTAIGLFLSIINFILLVIVNNISKKLSDTSLW